jgi:hypothetical protein
MIRNLNGMAVEKKRVTAVDERTGRYQVATGLTKTDLEKLAANPTTTLIQFASPLTNNEIDQLEKLVFSRRPDIMLRVWGHHGTVCDLRFVERLPSVRRISADCLHKANGIENVVKLKNLEHLGVGIFDLDNFDFLDKINPNLTELSLHQTKSKKPSINAVSRFSRLKFLYLEDQQKGIEAINQLKNLRRIVLRSISTKNVDYLEGLTDLWNVDIKLGGIKNFDALTRLPNLKYLELWQVRGLSDLNFISKLKPLQFLFLQSLAQVEQLPDVAGLISLRRVYLENLRALRNLASLRHAPSLEEFIFVLAQRQQPEDIIPVLENLQVRSVSCGFGDALKNKRFDELTRQHNKNKYQYSEFEFN